MLENIKVWWYYSVLKKVLLDSKGQPYDRRGLQIVDGELIINSREWRGYSYWGNGRYYSPDWGGSIKVDLKNPFYWKHIKPKMLKFKGFNL